MCSSCPAQNSLFGELRYRFDDKRAAIFVELIPFVESIGQDIFKSVEHYLKEECSDMVYSPEQFERDWDRHVDALCALIPPIEFPVDGKPEASSLTSILNVGWAALLTKLDKVGGVVPEAHGASTSRMERLNELLLKAVELSEARRLWDEFQ